MREWQNPEMWELAAKYTEGSLTGAGEDHIRIEIGGYKVWGNNPSG